MSKEKITVSFNGRTYTGTKENCEGWLKWARLVAEHDEMNRKSMNMSQAEYQRWKADLLKTIPQQQPLQFIGIDEQGRQIFRKENTATM